MNIFKSITLRTSGETCQKCIHFHNDPTYIEHIYPGLTAMSSGFASVRDCDGLCNHNQIYLSAGDTCSGFVPGNQTADLNIR